MMYDWKILNEEPPEAKVPRGSFLLLKDNSWMDEWVVLMLAEWIGDPDCRHSLVRTSGSKSGINPLQLIPNSCFKDGESLTVGWLRKNWNDWIWMDSDLATVKICYSPVSVDCFK